MLFALNGGAKEIRSRDSGCILKVKIIAFLESCL